MGSMGPRPVGPGPPDFGREFPAIYSVCGVCCFGSVGTGDYQQVSVWRAKRVFVRRRWDVSEVKSMNFVSVLLRSSTKK
jgi:hypothetical protein